MDQVPDLQRADELPSDYRYRLEQLSLVPAWTLLRSIMPVGEPKHRAQAMHWAYKTIRPELIRAAELTPMEKAERRVLAYVNRGIDPERLSTMPTIFFGLQLIMPGERAPNHKHIPAAARLIIEGSGAYTTVDHEKLSMEEGDVILTPPLYWHDHGHEGSEPVVWMDVLDHPIAVPMDLSYVKPGAMADGANNKPDASATCYLHSGLAPYRPPGSGAPDYPLRRYRWARVRESLDAVADASARGEAVHLRYTNPESGDSILKTLDFSARAVRPGELVRFERCSANRVLQVIEGTIDVEVNRETFKCEKNDTVTVPTYAEAQIHNSGSKRAYLIQVDDIPTQIKLGFFESWADKRN